MLEYVWDSQVKCSHEPEDWFPGFCCVFDNCDGYLGEIQ